MGKWQIKTEEGKMKREIREKKNEIKKRKLY